ncbi:NACHT domain-containing protein [Streptomyces beigongshangae]|uniref:NACHT domain-containing protein n=1 Tax=Streptomyces beigongshangae TaxID=2841597 RepID=UPI001C85EF98|nr:NACHT domain-containing protein [Streptomyces sp. REN17]
MRVPLREARVRRRIGLGAGAAALLALAVAPAGGGGPEGTSMWISAVSALVSVLAFLADLLREPADTGTGADRRQRAADELAEAVRVQWAAESRLRRLQDPEPLDVHWSRAGPPLADRPEAVRRGAPLPEPRDGDQRLDRIVDTFTALPSRRLVVLGEAGAGKTVLAVRFVLGTLDARQPGAPVPVLFPLAGWDPGSTALRDWLAERLAAEYRPLAAVTDERTMARELLDAGLLLPVLDGFDELPGPAHEAALRRLNTELDERLPVLLTCRTEVWTRAVRTGGVLTAADVVRLRPLDFATARRHLERTARPDADGSTPWTPVLADPPAPLAEVMASPLMVALARTVYGDASRDPAELGDTARFPTAGHIEEHLLDAFVPAAFGGAGPGNGPWSPDAAHRWLRRLARDTGGTGGADGSGGAGTWRLAWWELPAAMPRALRVSGPAVLALVASAALLVPLAVYGPGVVANWDSPLSAVLNYTGILLGLCFGLALLLPATAQDPQGPRQLARLALTMAAAATVIAVGMGLFVPPLVSSRLGAVLTQRPAWFLNGCCFGLILSMMAGVAGLPRRPLPMGLPWAGSPSGPRAVRALGAVVVFVGLALHGYFGEAVPALTCVAAGLLLHVSGLRRGERTATPYTGPGAVLRGFGKGLLRGFVACTLIGVCVGALVGCVAGAFAADRIRSAAPHAPGEVIGGWRLETTAEGGRSDRSVRSVRSVVRQEVLLVGRTGLAKPFAVRKGARISSDGVLGSHTGTVRIHEGRDGWVTVWRGGPGEWTGRPVDAHNLVLALPYEVRVWLVHRGAGAVVLDAVVPYVAFGVLIGAIGGCASGVYRALNTPSDTMRAAGPHSTLRTDRDATLARSAIAALLSGGACLALISAMPPGGTLGTMHTEVWVQVGTSALALSAWGRLGPARVWLALTGRAPWRLMGFLAEAHRRGVLRQSGARYEFCHLRLQQSLAASAAPGGQGPAVTTTTATTTATAAPGRGEPVTDPSGGHAT